MKKILLFYGIFFTALPACTASINSVYTNKIFNLINYILGRQIPSAKKNNVSVGYMAMKGDISDYGQYFSCLKFFADNQNIDLVMLDINSNGGSGATAEIISDFIQKLKIKKPVIAFIADGCFSAAYWIAASCSYIIAPPTATIGSIGTVSTFTYDKDIVTTFITSGKYKMPAYQQTGELEPKFKDFIQEQVNQAAEHFFASIADQRNIPLEEVRGLEAKWFLAPQALALGLIDQVGTIDAVIQTIVQFAQARGISPCKQIFFIDQNGSKIQAFSL